MWPTLAARSRSVRLEAVRLSGTDSTPRSLDPPTAPGRRARPLPRGPSPQTMQSKLTTRSQEAITAAQRLAVDRGQAALEPLHLLAALLGDRKSTRLNSSHANISYAVFCLKKK